MGYNQRTRGISSAHTCAGYTPGGENQRTYQFLKKLPGDLPRPKITRRFHFRAPFGPTDTFRGRFLHVLANPSYLSPHPCTANVLELVANDEVRGEPFSTDQQVTSDLKL